ncbi:MAG: tol-pal system-associated acyl-CoA thioesterase [Emcibacter sp.]|nr:tol-pal system-associated acyl-CoA thioesterase [Emcibacter sp.]
MPIRVYYEDTDAGGIVYFANYLKFMERGRSDMLRLLEIEQGEMLKFQKPDDFKFVVSRTEVDYLKPAKLGDVVLVHTRLSKFGGASLMMEQDIWRSGERITKALVKAVALNKDDRPVRLPKEIVEKLKMVI